ncbi:MAG: hypothetical protein IJV32_05015 [Bacteroidales bacterium]|nr:hypothetical protein [Bacteroidales bacterium]
MRARQVLIFLLGVFALLGAGWISFPADGVAAGPLTLRFPSYKKIVTEASEAKVNVDSVLTAVEERFRMQEDTLSYYHDFFYNNPDRIYLPDDDITFFDPVFRRFEKDSNIVRVVHYGDSQIEMDRISADLRDALQERFGGMGTGMFPALSNVPSASIYRSASGGFVQYTMYGDSTTQRAGHNRYGIMAQVVQMSGGGTISLRGTKSKTAYERTRTFQTVTLLYGRASGGFKATAASDTLKPKAGIERLESGVTVMRWDFGKPVDKARITLGGNAEIYGITADGPHGVAVDNIPLRGCSGTIFSRISKPLMAESMELGNVGLIILQFGGNYMPVANSTQVISNYCTKIAEQIQYFHEAAPGAKILFIGPSDMGTSRNGRIVTRPRLPEMVDSLKATALRNDAAYWDLFRMMGGENSMVQWVKHVPAYAGADYTHFTPAGAQKVGEALSRSFLTYYDYYRLRQEQ